MNRKFNILYYRTGISICAIVRSTEHLILRLNDLLSQEDVTDVRVFEVCYFESPTLIE